MVPPHTVTPLLVVVGEGAIAGLAAGAALGAWNVRLNDDWAHGTLWLAADRMTGPLLAGALWGVLTSILMAAGLALLSRRGRSATLAGCIVLGAIVLAGSVMATGPVRANVFPLAELSSAKLSTAVIAFVLAVLATLFARRAADAARRAPHVPGPDEDMLRDGPVDESEPGGAEPARAGRRKAAGTGASPPEGATPAGAALLPGPTGYGAPRAGGALRRSVAQAGIAGLVLAASAWLALPWIGDARAAGRPSVILVSIDTLRADRVGGIGRGSARDLPGSDRRLPPLTPRLDALAAEGALFEQASSAAPWTLPAHVSVFTSMLPFDHHVRWSRSRIHPMRSMLAERFRDAGYRTAAFTGGAYVASAFGFGQGFQTYEDHDEEREGGPEAIAAEALDWMRRAKGSSFFVFIHTYEPHSPYTHPDFADPREAGRLGATVGEKDITAVQQGRLELSGPERRHVARLYDGDVAHADRVMGGLLERLEQEGILDRSILIILSDHGEDLWDHDLRRSPGHGHSLYQELLHVPLIVRARGVVRAGMRFRTPVSLLDVAPTVLELAGLPPDPDHRGRSLAAALRTGEEPEATLIFAESVEYGPDRFALREGDRKVIRTPFPDRFHNGYRPRVSRLEVFDLASDPFERWEEASADRRAGPGAASLPHGLGALVEKVDKRAARALHAPPANAIESTTAPEDLLEQLQSLGYVQ